MVAIKLQSNADLQSNIKRWRQKTKKKKKCKTTLLLSTRVSIAAVIRIERGRIATLALIGRIRSDVGGKRDLLH